MELVTQVAKQKHDIELLSADVMSEEEQLLMKIALGEIKTFSNEEVLRDLKEALEL